MEAARVSGFRGVFPDLLRRRDARWSGSRPPAVRAGVGRPPGGEDRDDRGTPAGYPIIANLEAATRANGATMWRDRIDTLYARYPALTLRRPDA